MVINYFLSIFKLDQWLAARLGSSANQIITTMLSSLSIYIVISVFYDISFWMLSGQTPGKRILGLRVLRTDGKRLMFRNAFWRRVGYYISTILYLGFIWILFDNKRQGFHDKIAGTIVTYSWPEEDGKAPLRAAGSVKKKPLPSPSTLSTHIRPPCPCTTCLAMANPRPVPPPLRARSAL